jgi:hypothetical protein
MPRSHYNTPRTRNGCSSSSWLLCAYINAAAMSAGAGSNDFWECEDGSLFDSELTCVAAEDFAPRAQIDHLHDCLIRLHVAFEEGKEAGVLDIVPTSGKFANHLGWI